MIRIRNSSLVDSCFRFPQQLFVVTRRGINCRANFLNKIYYSVHSIGYFYSSSLNKTSSYYLTGELITISFNDSLRAVTDSEEIQTGMLCSPGVMERLHVEAMSAFNRGGDAQGLGATRRADCHLVHDPTFVHVVPAYSPVTACR